MQSNTNEYDVTDSIPYETDGSHHDENQLHNGEDYEYEEDMPPEPLDESERVKEYYKRGYKWPIPNEMFIPNTTGWIHLMNRRIQQVEKYLVDESDRYEGFRHIVTTSFIVPNFTQYGFGMTHCLDDNLMNELRDVIASGLDTAELEPDEPAILGPLPPLMVSGHDDLLHRILYGLQGYAETWSGIELIPYGAYGFRVYQNESSLLMHIDEPQTHVISFILHIASSDDAQPWPLYIEDFDGNTHEVTLTSGDLLFYESSKLLHGRPKPLNGSWYCSVFVHYYPKYPINNWSQEIFTNREPDYAVPPHWINSGLTSGEDDDEDQDNDYKSIDHSLPKIELIDTAMRELHCPNDWCGTVNTIRWGGPCEKNVLLEPNQQKQPFYPKQMIDEALPMEEL